MDDGGCRLRFRWEQCPLSDFFRTFFNAFYSAPTSYLSSLSFSLRDELPNVEDAVRILQGAEVVAATFPWRSCCHHRAKHVWLAHASHRSFCSSTKTLIEVTVGAYTNRSHPWTVIPLGVPGATNLLFDLDQNLHMQSSISLGIDKGTWHRVQQVKYFPSTIMNLGPYTEMEENGAVWFAILVAQRNVTDDSSSYTSI
ncbi:hypothetical protein glysoja_009560 [Glycine soja]|nr:hypothetical protein glysoja_009560 [Glycine soja]